VYKSSQNSELDLKKSEAAPKIRSKGEETRERIFQLALEYFNRNGIEYVGIRELARELGLSPGNVSYYFPSKDDLVIEITKRLSEANTQLFQEIESDLTLTSFIELFNRASHNHYSYRCIFTSFVHIMKHYPAIGNGYLEIQRVRRATLAKDLQALSKFGYLKKDLSKTEINHLVLMISHLARFWVQEAEVLLAAQPIESSIGHYTGLIAGTLHPYATAKGRQQLEPFMAAVITKL
jgi:AcrR family transcriptional regulator